MQRAFYIQDVKSSSLNTITQIQFCSSYTDPVIASSKLPNLILKQDHKNLHKPSFPQLSIVRFFEWL